MTSLPGVPLSSTVRSGFRLVPTIVALLPKQVWAARAGPAGRTAPARATTSIDVNSLEKRNVLSFEISPTPALVLGFVLTFPVAILRIATSPLLAKTFNLLDQQDPNRLEP